MRARSKKPVAAVLKQQPEVLYRVPDRGSRAGGACTPSIERRIEQWARSIRSPADGSEERGFHAVSPQAC